MIANKCLVDLPEKREFLINPIIDYYTVLEKVNFKVIYNPFFRKNFGVQQRFGNYPIYFPEVGCLAALETISPNLSREFYEETKEFDRFYSDEKVICSKIYNFNNEVNRFVSWGNYVSSKLPEEYYKLYISNLINDFLFMPSLVKRFGLISPNRWFILRSKTSYYFETEVNYNVGIIYLTKDILKKSKKIVIWLNSPPIEIWEIPAGFITFTIDGNVLFIDKILVHFLKEPIEEIDLISNKGEYFTCFLLSLNDYKTNFPKFKPSVRKKVNINLIENLTDLVHSPYEIIPFIFPEIMESLQMDKLIFEFEIKKDVLLSIIKRLMKFSSAQHPELLKSYKEIFENQNKLFKIKEKSDKLLKVTIVNPAVVPFLLKEYISGRRFGKVELLNNLINDPDDAIKTLKDVQNEPPTSWKWHQVSGIGNITELRKKIFVQYTEIWKQNKIPRLGGGT